MDGTARRQGQVRDVTRTRRRISIAAGGAAVVATAGLLSTGSTLADAAPRRAVSATAVGDGARQVLLPVSGVTRSGTASRRDVAALRVLDQSGGADDWSRYQEYGGHSAGTPYDGYVDLRPANGAAVPPTAGFTLVVNYRGPAAEQQRWTWSLMDRTDRSWVPVGSNAGAPGWGSWRALEFPVPGAAARFVATDGSVRVRLTSSDAVDDADLDYLAVTVSGGAGSSPTPTAGSTATSAPPTPTASPGTPTAGAGSTSTPTGTATQPAPGRIALPPADGVFDYQIGGAYAPGSDVDIVDRDRTDAPAAGKYNICYINGYQTQPGDSGTWPAGTLLRNASGGLVEDEGWPGEYMLDTRSAGSRDLIARVVRGWMAGCRDAGFQAVEIDNLDTYTRTSLLTKAGNLALAELYVQDAHALGLAIGQKNTVEIATEGRRRIGFDFAVAEECQVYDECDGYVSAYGAQVYEVEYPDAGGRAGFQAACAARGARISITYRDRNVVPRGRSAYVFEHC